MSDFGGSAHGEPWPPVEDFTPRGVPESTLFLDYYETSNGPIAPDVREALDNRADRRRFEAYAVARMRQLTALLPEPPPGDVSPCVAVGVAIDASGQRYIILATSGKSHFPRELEAARHPNEKLARFGGKGLDAEARIVAMMEHLRWRDERLQERGLEPRWPGLRLEGVAASYQICWERCQPVLRREGTKPLTALKSRPAHLPEPEAPLAYGPAPEPRRLGPRHTPRKGPQQ